MDPTTTLVTFLLQTHPSVQSVELIGSWDNFSTAYTMKRDVRRGRGQWRGCYSFKDIVCDDGAIRRSSRNGGLKMGATYYYYYEVDGSTETHDPAEPSTTACPYLPGQTVNTLNVPVERSHRNRSASLSSMHHESFRTMDPDARFTKPRPAAAPPSETTVRRLASASSFLHARPPSPSPSWKRFFARTLSTSDSDLDSHDQSVEHSALSLSTPDQTCCSAPSKGSRPRAMSPASLSRFLSQDTPPRPDPNPIHPSPVLAIPEDIAEEVDDDSATPAFSENQVYVTSLAPPPCQRSVSSDTVALTVANPSSLTLTALRPAAEPQPVKRPTPGPSAGPVLARLATGSQPLFSGSAASSVLATPVFPELMEDEPPSFYDSNDEDEEVLSTNDDDNVSHQPLPSLSSTGKAFKGYCLPRQIDGVKSITDSSTAVASPNSPQVLARSDYGVPISGANLLGTTIDTGLDDFVNELGWIVDVIGNKQE